MSDVVANSERSPRNGHWLRAVTDDVHSTTVRCELLIHSRFEDEQRAIKVCCVIKCEGDVTIFTAL